MIAYKGGWRREMEMGEKKGTFGRKRKWDKRGMGKKRNGRRIECEKKRNRRKRGKREKEN